ncbi:Arsenite methyltransferase [Candidatus Entotheonellaceae bacterium PAL068K]
MTTIAQEAIRAAVRERYGHIAETRGVAAEPAAASCCGNTSMACGDHTSTTTFDEKAQVYGYSADDTEGVPEGANLGLGCGNPVAIAALRPGETVLDLGSGAGFDCFLAARAVGETGQVIGVDMTHEMLDKARQNAAAGGYTNVTFRLGEIEHLPVADQSIDVIISNCVINLSPEKPKVFGDAFRVLKPGGRLAVSDVVATALFPAEAKNDLVLRAGCIAGASLINDVEQMLADAGFSAIRIEPKAESQTFIREWVPGSNIADYLVSATIEAVKPAG